MYDVIVLGSGLTGLAAAALLARDGQRVLLIGDGQEAEAEACFPLYHNDAEQGVLAMLLDRLGADVTRTPLPVIDRILLPGSGVELRRPRVFAAYREELEQRYPEARDALAKYFDVVEGLGREWLGVLAGDLRMVPQDVPYCMRYFSLTYAKFVQKTCGEYPQLAAVLSAGLPTADTALTVMAGYLYGQVFDACVLDGGLPAVRRALDEVLERYGCERVTTREPVELLPAAEGLGVRFADGSVCRAGCLLDTRGDGEEPGPADARLSFFSVLIVLQEPMTRLPGAEVWHVLPERDVSGMLSALETGDLPDEVPLVLWNPDARAGLAEKRRLRIDVPVAALGSEAAYDELLGKVMAQAESCLPGLGARIASVTAVTPEEHGRQTGWDGGSGTRWAFSVKRVMKDPLNMETQRTQLYDTKQWGFAWFSAAYVAARQIRLQGNRPLAES
ncbi:FAD-binding protein [Tumebacillus sp. DT12]|uniref:FAD-binding protein n=1 Tax=Tumebacillus lacus TaxID=2995335 RepID=A0ABT3X4F2_9BACL|nr:FAD-binding protein [Tumebacillus lacus]MCX7571784.1 FAD-binding protein [Tumebacillus lacus]